MSLALTDPITSFEDELRIFDSFGAKTREIVEDNIPYFINEFWTSGQRRAHSIHEVSYRACFKPQLPEFFIARLTQPGDGVYDPFMGRGTTPVQAALQARRAMGNDINPLSVMLTRPRLAPPSLVEIESACENFRGALAKSSARTCSPSIIPRRSDR